jgi:hypothetical protein
MLSKSRTAIIIGINQYIDNDIPELKGAENDARELYEILSNPKFGNFEIPQENFLLGKDAKRESIVRSLSNVFYKTEEYDLVLFYFSGHGFVDNYSDGYVAPYDMIRGDPIVFGINMLDLKNMIVRSINKKNTLMIMDCCNSGVTTNNDKSIVTSPNSERKSIYENYLEEIESEGKIVLAATEADTKAKEKEYTHPNGIQHTHGVFTYSLLEALKGSAGNQNGYITLGNIVKYLENSLKSIQKPKMSVVKGTGIADLKICIDPKIHSKRVEELISTCLLSCDSLTISSLHQCTKGIVEIELMDPTHTKLPELKSRVSKSLQTYKGRINEFLCKEELNVRPTLENITRNNKFYENLFDYEHRLSFEEFKQLGEKDIRIMSAICDVVIGGRLDVFYARCTTNSLSTPVNEKIGN